MKVEYSQPTFKIFDTDELQAYFDWGTERHEIFELYYDSCHLLEDGEQKEATRLLNQIIKKDKYFIDAFVSLSHLKIESYKWEEAIALLDSRVDSLLSLIPNTYDGTIQWSLLGNRPFLRALHCLGLAYYHTGEFEKTVFLFQKILRYNPSDNIGVRYLIGDAYLLLGKKETAEKYYERIVNEYPPGRYSYAMLLFLLGKKSEAVTQFRLGFVENIYIAEFLIGKNVILKYKITCESNFNDVDEALNYYKFTINLWFLKYPKVHSFLKKLFLDEEISNEIFRILGYDYQLIERDLTDEKSNEIIDVKKKAISLINNQTSAKIAKRLRYR